MCDIYMVVARRHKGGAEGWSGTRVNLMVLVRVMSATDNIKARWCNWHRLSGIMNELCGENGRHGEEIVVAACGGGLYVPMHH